MTTHPMEVRALPEERLPAAISMLADAFMHETLYSHLYPQESNRHEHLMISFKEYLRELYPYNHTYEIGDATTGLSLAVFAPPGGDFDDPMWAEYESHHLPTLTEIEQRNFLEFQKWFDVEREKAHGVGAGDNDTFWLVLLATEERARGKGQGSALIEHGLAIADSMHVACSLETASPASAEFYAKFGFKTHHTALLPYATDDSKLVHFMRREAR